MYPPPYESPQHFQSICLVSAKKLLNILYSNLHVRVLHAEDQSSSSTSTRPTTAGENNVFAAEVGQGRTLPSRARGLATETGSNLMVALLVNSHTKASNGHECDLTHLTRPRTVTHQTRDFDDGGLDQ